MPSMKPETKKLTDLLFAYEKFYSQDKWPDVFPQALKEFSEKDLITILKDPFWKSKDLMNSRIHYKYISDSWPDKKQNAMICSIINSLLKILVDKNHKTLDLFCQHGQGIILLNLIYFLNYRRSPRMDLLIKRALKDSNLKIRRKGAELAPASKLKKYLKDSNFRVREVAIKRLGFYNVAKELLDEPNPEYRLSAAIYLNRKDKIMEILNEVSEKLSPTPYAGQAKKGSFCFWRLERLAYKAIQELDKSDIPYYLDLKEHSGHLRSIIEEKLSSQ